MTHVALVPLSLYRVKYQVATGRPYSELDRLTLEVIASEEGRAGGIDGVEMVADYFRVHPRIATEVLVTLTHAGWLAVAGSQSGGFVLTAEGRVALESNQLPPAHLVSGEKPATVVLDRIAGLLAASDEVTYTHRARLEKLKVNGETLWDQAVRLPITYAHYNLDQGEVQRYLPRPQGSWLERVGDIQRVSTSHWAAVAVDLEEEKVTNLPPMWADTLRQPILAHVRRTANSSAMFAVPRGLQVRASRGEHKGWIEARLTHTDVIDGREANEALLRHVLRDCEGPVFVASPRLDSRVIDHWEADLGAALSARRKVDILWGQSEAAGEALSRLKKLRADFDADDLLRFNELPSPMNASLLLWRSIDDEFCAAVGATSWLGGSRESGEIGGVTIVMREPQMVAALARCAAGLSPAGTAERMSAMSWHWSELAALMEQRSNSGSPAAMSSSAGVACRVRVVRDTEHQALMRTLVGATMHEEFVSSVGARSAEVEHRTTGTNVLIVDGSALVGRYDYRATAGADSPSRRAELSICVTGEEAVDWIRRAADM